MSDSKNTYEVIQISETSWRIEDGNVRAYLFAGQEKALLLDTGVSGGDLRGVVEGLTDRPVILVNSHADGDHCASNYQYETTHMHPAEFSYYYAEEKKTPAKAIWDGDIIDIGGRSFEAIVIPGHTHGSIALLDRKNRIILTGDTVSHVPVYMFGWMRNIKAYRASLEKLNSMTDSFDEIYPCHGPFPVKPDAIQKLINTVDLVLEGKIDPQDTPFPSDAKMYMNGDVGLYY